MAVSMIGDIDRDGISDVAISAPYEASGVVYIYRGSRGGLIAEYQVAGEGGREGEREGGREGWREVRRERWREGRTYSIPALSPGHSVLSSGHGIWVLLVRGPRY